MKAQFLCSGPNIPSCSTMLYSPLRNSPGKKIQQDMKTETITGVVLAGGRGSRMGHVDKGLQLFRGTPLAGHVLHRLQRQAGHLLINANQNLSRYREFGVPVWPDEMQGFAGPLAGVETALMHCDTEYLVTAPCDSPFLPHDLVARLGTVLEENDAELAFAVTGAGEQRQQHPVFCLMTSALRPRLTAFLQQGGRKVSQWHATLRVAEVHFANEAAFSNINTLDELQSFEKN